MRCVIRSRGVELMALYRKRSNTWEARRLIGTPAETREVMDWIVEYGLPWLVGDPEQPDLLENPQGEKHAPGIYLEPQFGTLVVRNRYRQSLTADYGDWIMRDTVNNNFTVMKHVAFMALYEPAT